MNVDEVLWKTAAVGSVLRVRAMRRAAEKGVQKRSNRRRLAAGAMLGAAGVLGAQKAMQAYKERRHA